ncbi:hypothetical protein J4456_02335 [Candidatus Pacearchaeota archaeon]|nr:hypothetical protein [Candidatus Pacearchaeota archaeon]
MKDQFKKKLTIEEFEEFTKHFPTSDISLVMLDKIPSFLTNSRDLQEKTLLVKLASGATVGMIFDIYRYDKKDEAKGTPINVNRYSINNNLELSQKWLPLNEHRISSGSFVALTSSQQNRTLVVKK